MLVSELGDPEGKGRGKKHIEPLFRMRHSSQHVAHVLDESEVEHAIRFVNYRHLNRLEMKDALLEVVDESAGGSNQYIHPVIQHLALLLVTGAPKHEPEIETGVTSEHSSIFMDLQPPALWSVRR